MNLQQHPLLTALYARGGAAYAGELLSYLLIEVRGECLWITGVTPLRDNGCRFTASGREYHYILECNAAEKFLSTLCQNTSETPEHIIARDFEFSRPHCLLKDYLDSLQIPYQYHVLPEAPL